MQNIGLLPLSSLCARLNWFVLLLLFWDGVVLCVVTAWLKFTHMAVVNTNL